MIVGEQSFELGAEDAALRERLAGALAAPFHLLGLRRVEEDHGLGRERDRALNEALEASLAPIRDAARELGANAGLADLIMADAFAHASGVLLLAHTRRIRMFGTPPRALMERHVETELNRLQRGV